MHRYDVLKEGVRDVKWDQLICQRPQLHTSKIRGAQYSSSVTLIYTRQVSAKQCVASMFYRVPLSLNDDANLSCM
jgi:hypothetical protein